MEIFETPLPISLLIDLMAKKKIKEEVAEEAVIATENDDATPVTLDTPTEVSENKPVKAESQTKQNPEEIPAQVLGYLKRHPELEGVYVDARGGKYPMGINQVFVKDASLYHNPYFKH